MKFEQLKIGMIRSGVFFKNNIKVLSSSREDMFRKVNKAMRGEEPYQVVPVQGIVGIYFPAFDMTFGIVEKSITFGAGDKNRVDTLDLLKKSASVISKLDNLLRLKPISMGIAFSYLVLFKNPIKRSVVKNYFAALGPRYFVRKLLIPERLEFLFTRKGTTNRIVVTHSDEHALGLLIDQQRPCRKEVDLYKFYKDSFCNCEASARDLLSSLLKEKDIREKILKG